MKKKLLVLSIVAMFAYSANAQSTQTTTTTTTNQTTVTPSDQAPATQPAQATAPAPPATPAPVAVDDNNDSKFGVPRFYIGARLFGTASNFKVNTVENNNVVVAKTSTKLGYGFGGYFGFNLTKHFAIQPEVIYSTLSQKYKDKGLDRKIDISYLHIPLMFVFNTNITKPVNLNIAAGPQLGINTGAKLSATSQGNAEVVNTTFAVKPTDIGVAYGAGLDFRLVPSLSLGVGFRGVMGLLDISDKNSTATYSSTDANGVVTTQTVVVLDKSKVKSYGGYVGLRLNF